MIGNGAYRFNNTLKNPPNDATDMASALKRDGFRVTLLTDAGRDVMEKSVRAFGNSLKNSDTVGLFYYSGHGAQADGQNYLIPVDADIQDVDELRYKAMDVESILAKMRSAGNKLNIVILDACRNNPFPGSSRSGEKGLATVKVRVPESVIVFATDPGSTAEDGAGRNSPFTAAFMSVMEKPGLDIAVMMKQVTGRVQAATGGKQTPWVSTNLTKDFAFTAESGTAPAAQAAAPSPAPAPKLTVTRAYGSLIVKAATGGSLYLDGRLVGDIPAGAEARLDNVEAGDRSLELRYPDGKREALKRTVPTGGITNAAFSYVTPPSTSNPKPRPALLSGEVLVEGGVFQMGDTFGEKEETGKLVHEVHLSSFLIARYEVTQKQWRQLMGTNPSTFKGDDLPVESVSWYDAVEFCNKLSREEGLTPCYTGSGTGIQCNFSTNGYRLPPEAEWEYAAKGGRGSKGFRYAGGNDARQIAWFKFNSEGSTHQVGTKEPNELGLNDMGGNVREWCWDLYGDYPTGMQTNPSGAASGFLRVARGGCWSDDASLIEAASRLYQFPTHALNNLGFRLVRTSSSAPSVVAAGTSAQPGVPRTPPARVESAGQTTDFFALVLTGTPQDVQAALHHGANANAQNKDGKTPLMLAAGSNQNPEVITTLLKAGADLNVLDRQLQRSALIYAARSNPNPEVISTLLNAGADLKAPDGWGQTPLMYAAQYNPSPEVITTLLKAGADVKAQNKAGWTPLIYAAESSPNPEVIIVLLRAGADAKRKAQGKSAIDFAQDNEKLKGTDAYRQLQEATQ
ncbi:MAG: SUMF1/EgtB/PvdO family nonheme iron enzyme [Spirochaetia bacterium]